MISPKRFGVLLMTCCLIMGPFFQKAFADVGEDGIVYEENEKTGRNSKIDASLLKAAERDKELSVIIYLKSEDAKEEVQKVRAGYEPKIKSLSEGIQTIYRKYLPVESLAGDKEISALKNVYSMKDTDKKSLKEKQNALDTEMDAMRRDIGAVISESGTKSRESFIQNLTRKKGEVTVEIESVNAIGAVIPAAMLNDLAEDSGVRAVMPNPKTEYELDVSIPSAAYDDWWGVGYDGGAYDLGLVDSGVEESHPAFSSINFYHKPGASVTGSHGTHVAGIVASGDATYTGGAFGLDALIWANSSGTQATTMANMDWLATSAVQGPEVVNHSLGYGTADTDDYSANDSFYDAYVSNFDILVTKSCGNNGWNDTEPTITHPAPAYNLLAVANMDDQDTQTRTDDYRSSSSSVGPTVNNRKKPDITAPGTSIMSTNAYYSSGDDFIEKSGTSMAAPHVAAGVILMEDGGNHIPMAQKAVLINTADAWDCKGTKTQSDDIEVYGSHWDKSYGWGYIDMDEALYNRTDYFVDSVVPRNDNATADDYKLYTGKMYNSAYSIEKATLVWEKRSNYVSGQAPTSTYKLSDLNIRLYDESNGNQLDSDLDGNDNVHQVDISNGNTGWNNVVIKAYSWSTSFEGASSETFALATEENFVAADPPSFQRGYSRPNYVGPNQTFDVTVRIYNNGDVSAHNNQVTLSDITGVSMADNTKPIASIEPGPYPYNPESAVYTMTTSGLSAGTHWLPLSFESNCYLETYTYSTPYGVSLIVETTPPTSGCTSPTISLSSTINIDWEAEDTQTGVKRSYLYVKKPGDANFSYAFKSSTGTSGTFSYTATAGYGTYAFAIRSVDVGGNWEPTPTAAESSTLYTKLVIVPKDDFVIKDLTAKDLAVKDLELK